jgi:UDP-N-acetylmuramoyl-L-alanyl-D-glutamate--2,6-diaminopimelate ligase
MLEPSAFAALNDRDPASDAMAAATRARVVRWGGSPKADVRVRVVRSDLDGSKARIFFGKSRTSVPVRVGLVGRHNVENALAAAASAWAMGIPTDAIVRGIEGVRRVPGRLERVGSSGPRVLVDYAHTPEALDTMLAGLRPLVRGRLVVVFGCGGDRDRGKRPLMARAVERWADVAIVTSDNPRSEDPRAIAAEVVSGFRGSSHMVELDRRIAISAAVEGAWDDDLLVIAGKGHETGQIVAGRTIPFDDLEVAREALGARGR